MTLPVVFHELAELELDEASRFSSQTRRGLGEAFVSEVRDVVHALAASPLAGTDVGSGLRCPLLRRFPYRAIYRAQNDHIRVLAIAYQKRRPLYWRAR